ncbi:MULTISPECIES: hypothetical protein [unclassified Acidovorax]|uniref:hypothetical protein n=1 Tax=unclassified Acidovorax TaxID=2684926 RepID=UPI0028831F78|nr:MULTISPECIES: hypothetical protein [unclassified Acidovorax]
MEYLLQLLFSCPRCWRNIGRVMFTVCSTLALIGWQLASRVDRVERKTGVLVELDKVLASIPLPIPTTGFGIGLAVFGAGIGLALAKFGKWAEKAF